LPDRRTVAAATASVLRPETVASSQALTTFLPLTLTLVSGRPLGAGPPWTEPSWMENWLPWHGHLITPPSTLLTSQPWCVQTLLKALNVPWIGWVMEQFPLITPAPSGPSSPAPSTVPPAASPPESSPPASAPLL